MKKFLIIVFLGLIATSFAVNLRNAGGEEAAAPEEKPAEEEPAPEEAAPQNAEPAEEAKKTEGHDLDNQIVSDEHEQTGDKNDKVWKPDGPFKEGSGPTSSEDFTQSHTTEDGTQSVADYTAPVPAEAPAGPPEEDKSRQEAKPKANTIKHTEVKYDLTGPIPSPSMPRFDAEERKEAAAKQAAAHKVEKDPSPGYAVAAPNASSNDFPERSPSEDTEQSSPEAPEVAAGDEKSEAVEQAADKQIGYEKEKEKAKGAKSH